MVVVRKHLARKIMAGAACYCVFFLSGCPAPVGNGANPEKTALKSLMLVEKDAEEVNNLISFKSEQKSYFVDFTADDMGLPLLVTAIPEYDDVQVSILSEGAALKNGEVIVPSAGTLSRQINIVIIAGDESGCYTITLNTPQSDADDDYFLQSLFIGYTENDGNLISGMTGSNWSINTDNGESAATVTARPCSEKSNVEIYYENALMRSGSGQKGVTTRITLPSSNTSKKLAIVVYKGNNGGSNTYTVTINGYQAKKVTWSGTVSYEKENYKITGVIARNITGEMQAVQLGAPLKTGNGRDWKLTVGENFQPVFFSITLSAADDAADIRGSRAFPLPAIASPSRPITLSVSELDTAKRIANANEFYDMLSAAANAGKSFSLGSDIDLSTYKNANGELVDWKGPDGYAGSFYGNGYIIKNLRLTRTTLNKNDIGLFNTLKSGALIENFTLEVSSKIPYEPWNGNCHFGGVVGYIEDREGEIAIRNITVKGSLKIGKISGQYFLTGGLIGEVKYIGELSIENCISELTIDVQGDSTSAIRIGIGGLIGRIRNESTAGTYTTKLRNCYATGSLTIIAEQNTLFMFAGGLIGDVSSDTRGKTILTLENCYASGDITVSALKCNTDYYGAGGLIGLIHNENNGPLEIKIERCAAMNKKVLLNNNPSSSSTPKSAGRFAGYLRNNNIKAVLSNNIARLGMLTGNSPGTQNNTLGSPDDAGSTGELNALGKSEADFRNINTWTSSNGLNWNPEIWDFSGIVEGRCPVFKTIAGDRGTLEQSNFPSAIDFIN